MMNQIGFLVFATLIAFLWIDGRDCCGCPDEKPTPKPTPKVTKKCECGYCYQYGHLNFNPSHNVDQCVEYCNLACKLEEDAVKGEKIKKKGQELLLQSLFWREDHRCGPDFSDSDNGTVAGCNPDGRLPCCSPTGWCGKTSDYCKCEKCIDYAKIKREYLGGPKGPDFKLIPNYEPITDWGPYYHWAQRADVQNNMNKIKELVSGNWPWGASAIVELKDGELRVWGWGNHWMISEQKTLASYKEKLIIAELPSCQSSLDPSCQQCDPSWKASNGRGCEDYKNNKWCGRGSASGHCQGDCPWLYGSGWKEEWGKFEKYADGQGRSALVCPQCSCRICKYGRYLDSKSDWKNLTDYKCQCHSLPYAGQKCDEENYQIRLAGGKNNPQMQSTSGRVETYGRWVNYRGIEGGRWETYWAPVCINGYYSDGYKERRMSFSKVVCRQLGLGPPDTDTHEERGRGTGYGSSEVMDITCDGNEENINQCHFTQNNRDCTDEDIAIVFCSEQCSPETEDNS